MNEKITDNPSQKLAGPHVESYYGDSAHHQSNGTHPPPKRNFFRKFFKTSLIGLVLILALGAGAFAAKFQNLWQPISTNQDQPFLRQLSNLVIHQLSGKESFDKTEFNILLLGIGGSDHEGGYLSDTIIIAQVRPKDKQITLISLPRDLKAQIPQIGPRKLNAALAEGYLKNHDWNEAINLARETIEPIFGKVLPHTVIVDFKAFQEIIDILGGVEINIQKSFTDASFPDGDEGFLAPVTFKAGVEKMSGQRALIFARSRHASGNEGSDFARSVRQQQIIKAAKEKLISLANLQGIGTINQILTSLSQHIHTNFTPEEILNLYQINNKIGNVEIVSLSLNPDTGLICPQNLPDLGYILELCPGKTQTDLLAFFRSGFTLAKIASEKPKVLLVGSNLSSGKTRAIIQQLKSAGMQITESVYSEISPKDIIFYQVQKKPYASEYLSNTLKATEVVLPPPGLETEAKKFDLIIVTN